MFPLYTLKTISDSIITFVSTTSTFKKAPEEKENGLFFTYIFTLSIILSFLYSKIPAFFIFCLLRKLPLAFLLVYVCWQLSQLSFTREYLDLAPFLNSNFCQIQNSRLTVPVCLYLENIVPTSLVSNEKFTAISIVFPLLVRYCFSFAVFKGCFLSLVFRNLIMNCVGMDFFGSSLFHGLFSS